MAFFFDDYPEFYDGLNASPERLNTRYEVLIQNYKDIIENKTILDIACHDGRWGFAAIQNGAKFVLGIELQQEPFERGNKIFRKYGIPDSKYQFVKGDIHSEIRKVKENFVDTVFCFGFFYHTIYHMSLLEEIIRLKPTCIIFDTHISKSDQPIIELRTEKIGSGPKSKIYPNLENKIVVGWVSKSGIELMLSRFGYKCEFFDWQNSVKNWKSLGDYHIGDRITFLATQET